WERAGRPAAPNLARGTYSVAMVHGMRGDDDRRAAWVRLTIDLGVDPERLAGLQLGWPAVFDGLLALHRNDAAAAVRRLARDIDTPELFQSIGAGPWRPWYAALWAEAAVLDHRQAHSIRQIRAPARPRRPHRYLQPQRPAGPGRVRGHEVDRPPVTRPAPAQATTDAAAQRYAATA